MNRSPLDVFSIITDADTSVNRNVLSASLIVSDVWLLFGFALFFVCFLNLNCVCVFFEWLYVIVLFPFLFIVDVTFGLKTYIVTCVSSSYRYCLKHSSLKLDHVHEISVTHSHLN